MLKLATDTRNNLAVQHGYHRPMTYALVPVSFTSDVITDGVTHEDDSIGNDAWSGAVAIVQTSFIAISHPNSLRCMAAMLFLKSIACCNALEPRAWWEEVCGGKSVVVAGPNVLSKLTYNKLI